MSETTASDARARVVRAILAGVLLLEAVVVFGYGVYLVVETLTAEATEPGAAIALAGLVMLLGCGLAVLARASLRGRRGARAPIVVWQLLQASLYTAFSDRWYAAGALIASAVLTMAAAFVPGVLRDPEPEPDTDGGGD